VVRAGLLPVVAAEPGWWTAGPVLPRLVDHPVPGLNRGHAGPDRFGAGDGDAHRAGDADHGEHDRHRGSPESRRAAAHETPPGHATPEPAVAEKRQDPCPPFVCRWAPVCSVRLGRQLPLYVVTVLSPEGAAAMQG
jgi:hypothetical protein